MLRYFYLLSFLLCIELSFSYNYLDELTELNLSKFGRNVRRDKERAREKARRLKERKSLIRQEYDYDRSPVEFDVASFIQPEEDAVEDDETLRHRNKKRRRISKSFDDGASNGYNGNFVEEGYKKREKSPDYLNVGDSNPDLNINPPLFKDAINIRHVVYNSLDDLHSDNAHDKYKNLYKDDSLLTQDMVHNHEKKCTLKHIKFPFFSHNKSEITKPKRNKKRKLFRFSCPKKGEHRQIIPDFSNLKEEPRMLVKVKRSYEQKLCPACKKLFVSGLDSNRRRKKTPKRIIHNSRQHYQTYVPGEILKEDLKRIRKNVATSESAAEGVENAEKRGVEADRERQLKELEAVQKKVDGLEVRVPTFEKPAQGKSSR
ncbi:unnamed protein product [Chrysodeixis includens]|uniref:Uncharacterized protein n=1 Tax=Chrysodeixis includens TaxID=689277 RepID=A0A9P0C229_CHRIL|nr:unnamed protein product [Chrysodeixis includens]